MGFLDQYNAALNEARIDNVWVLMVTFRSGKGAINTYKFKPEDDLTDKEKRLIKQSQSVDYIISRDSTDLYRVFDYRRGDINIGGKRVLTYFGTKAGLEKTIGYYENVYTDKYFKPDLTIRPETEKHFGDLFENRGSQFEYPNGYKEFVEPGDRALFITLNKKPQINKHTYRVIDARELTAEDRKEMKGMDRMYDTFPFLIYYRKVYDAEHPKLKKLIMIGSPQRIGNMLERYVTIHKDLIREETPMKSKTREHFRDIVESYYGGGDKDWVLALMFHTDSGDNYTGKVGYILSPKDKLPGKFQKMYDHVSKGEKITSKITNMSNYLNLYYDYDSKTEFYEGDKKSLKLELNIIKKTWGEDEVKPIVPMNKKTEEHFRDII